MRVHYWELSNYNNGILVGRWFDLDGVTKDEHYSELQDWLKELTETTGQLCEEWILGDSEGIPSRYVSEYGLDAEIFDFIELVDNGCDSEMLEAGLDAGLSLDSIEDAFMGEASSDIEFIQDYWEHSGQLAEIPDHIVAYLDWEAIARDSMIGDFVESNGYYFHNC